MSITRRSLIASSLAVPTLALLNKSTFANAPQPSLFPAASASNLPSEYQQAADDLAAIGRKAVEAVLNRDDQALTAMMSGAEETTATEIIEPVEGGRVTFAVPDFDAFVDATFDGSQQMSGFYNQITISRLELETGEEQTGKHPTGTWWGTLAGFLEVSIDFGYGDSAPSLSVPSAGTWVSLDEVQVETERPVGELIAERSLPVGGGNSQYAAKYGWSDDAALTIVVVIDDNGFVSQVVAWPEFDLPEDPAADIESSIGYQLPVDGDWLVVWGGDTEFENYHAVVPLQRHAYDLMAWENGATFQGDGTSNSDYFAFGRPVFAPAAGTVISTANWIQDSTPGVVADFQGMDAVGNHVVLQTGPEEYVLLAHMQEGSALVNVGDTVEAGQQIGSVGNSGYSSQAHLHIHVHTLPVPIDVASTCLRLPFTNVIANGKQVGKAELQQGQIIRAA